MGLFKRKDAWLDESKRDARLGAGAHQELLQLTDAVEKWVRLKSFNLEYGRLLGGESGAYVAVMRRTSKEDKPADVVIKLVPPDAAEGEIQSLLDAGESQPNAFRESRLMLWHDAEVLPDSSWRVYLQRLALSDFGSMEPLADLLDHEDFGVICSVILESLMQDWAIGTIFAPEVAPREFLESFLENHLSRDELRGFIDRHELHGGKPFITLPGRRDPLANPFALLRGTPADWQGGVQIVRGNTHGDLHLRNVLVPVGVNGRVSADHYRLIDLGRFAAQGARALDAMRMLLTIAWEWLPSLTPHSALRSCLAEAVVDPDNASRAVPLMGYRKVAEQIHQAARSWAKDVEQSAWTRQNTLVLVGCALRYVSRANITDADRWWFLEVAALATQALIPVDDDRVKGPTSPTESSATGRMPVPTSPPEPPSEVSALDNVIQFPVPSPNPVHLLSRLVSKIEDIPAGTGPARLAVVSVSLVPEAEKLEAALESASEVALVRRDLQPVLRLLQRFRDQRATDETLGELRAAARELRVRAERRWPGEVG